MVTEKHSPEKSAHLFHPHQYKASNERTEHRTVTSSIARDYNLTELRQRLQDKMILSVNEDARQKQQHEQELNEDKWPSFHSTPLSQSAARYEEESDYQ